MRHMERLREELGSEIPKLGETQNNPDPLARARFYEVRAGWVWYVIEFDGSDMAFGYVVGFESEYGYFNLSELESIHWPSGPGVRCDHSFTPTRMMEVVDHEALRTLDSHRRRWREDGEL